MVDACPALGAPSPPAAPAPLVGVFSHVAGLHGLDDWWLFQDEEEGGEEEPLPEATVELELAAKPFWCDLCPARFTRRSRLTVHQRVHSGEKPFGCDLCPAQFSERGSLTAHQRVHSGEKPFGCDLCPARFSVRGSLARHRRVHSGER